MTFNYGNIQAHSLAASVVWVATNTQCVCLQYMGWGLCMCLHVLNLGEQERAWII